MKIGNKGLKLIKKWEGFKNHPYLDTVGIPTIGYGNTYYEDGRKVKMTDKPITIKEGEQLLKNVVKQFEIGVNKLVISDINQNQFDALVSFSYNLGLGALSKSTLLKKVNEDPCNELIKGEFKKWVNAGGKKLKGLVKRRNDEAYLYFQ